MQPLSDPLIQGCIVVRAVGVLLHPCGSSLFIPNKTPNTITKLGGNSNTVLLQESLEFISTVNDTFADPTALNLTAPATIAKCVRCNSQKRCGIRFRVGHSTVQTRVIRFDLLKHFNNDRLNNWANVVGIKLKLHG